MRVLVDKMPKEPAECCFSRRVFVEDKTKKNGLAWDWGCNMNNKLCDLKYNGTCDKLVCYSCLNY